MDPEKLIDQWWTNSSVLPIDCEDWAEKSYTNPKPFWEALFALHQRSKRVPLQSSLESHYDFYHDCILRHLSSNDTAYTLIGKNGSQSWTYKQLHSAVNFQVGRWSKHHPQPGQLLALVLEPGIEFLIALLTALRLGLTLCFLPPCSSLGKEQIKKMLADIKPQLIVAATDFSIAGIPHLTIDPQAQEEKNHEPLSFPYKAAASIQITVSLYRQEPLAFVPLDAETVYLHALRDALFTLNLREHSTWSAPLTCPIRTEPCSTLMTLLAGARQLYVADETLQTDPQILKDEKVHLLGVSSALQQLWSQTPAAPTRSLKACFKAPLDIRYQAWKAFIQRNKMEKVSAFHLLMDNSRGGSILSSKPSQDSLDFFLKPSLGLTWSLGDIEGKPVNLQLGYGVFNSLLSSKENNLKGGNFILSQADKSYTLSGTVQLCREGVTFPLSACEELVKNLSFVEDCVLQPIQKPGELSNSHFVLLVFVDPMKKSVTEEEKRAWSQEILSHIGSHLGRGFLPDQMEFYPLYPRKKGKGIDRNWCANQYLSGLLLKKMKNPAFQTLHILKKLAAKDKTQKEPAYG